jgi:hypothetical protein
MSSIQTFSRLALKQFCALLEGVAVSPESSPGELEGALWSKIQAGNPDVERIRVPYPLLKKTLRKLKIELPYMPGIINYNIGCSALKVSGGLYLPCCGNCEEESAYCGVCSKQEVKYGSLEDRGDVGTYSDPFDKHEISYGTWLAKTEKTLEEVYEALESEGFKLVIPSHYLTVNSKRIVKEVKARKGRPKAAKKEVMGDDSDSGSTSESEEKPVKVKKAKAEKPKKVKSPKNSDGESDEEKPKKEKPKKAKSPKNSDEESDGEKPEKKEKKAKKVKAIEPEAEKKKEKKPKSPKAAKESEAEPEAGKKKEKKSKSPKGPETDIAEKWSNLVYGDDEGKKVKKPKSEKSKTDKPESEKKEKKEKKLKSPKGPENSNSTDMSARFEAELEPEEYGFSGFDARRETVLPEETVEVNGNEYILRGTLLFDPESGEKVGEMNEDGIGVLDPEDF